MICNQPFNEINLPDGYTFFLFLAKTKDEEKVNAMEKSVLEKIKASLDDTIPARRCNLSDDEKSIVKQL